MPLRRVEASLVTWRGLTGNPCEHLRG
ncbi:rCG50724 [Rattus norvegicus]|uniref:RCG50724 n=1 Tax=Rattus norvegicus TaxID=10116 RepID=A6KC28_RAT|nr:rCG50724 [Rattus norvegicus]